jgi:hypothetical protein
MMMKSLVAATTAAVVFVGSAAHATTISVDVFVTSFFNTSTNAQDTRFAPTTSSIGTLDLEFDPIDALPDGLGTSVVFFDDPFNFEPTSFDLSISLANGSASFDQTDFLISTALVDTGAEDTLRSVDFILLTDPADVAALGPNISDITTDPFDFLRTDANGVVTGVNLEIQTFDDVSPIPVPASLPMLAGGMMLLGFMRKKMKKA